MKKLFALMFLLVLPMFIACSSLNEEDSFGEQHQLFCDPGRPITAGSGGCKPKTLCPTNQSITGLSAGSFVGGNDKQLWIYYNGAWRLGIDLSTSINNVSFNGKIGGPGSPTIGELHMWNPLGGTLASIYALGIAPGLNPIFGEVVVYNAWWATPSVCSWDRSNVGFSRVVGLGTSTGDGTIEWSGTRFTGGVSSYVTCSTELRNNCSI